MVNCNICSKGYKSQKNLDKHIASKHEPVTTTIKSPCGNDYPSCEEKDDHIRRCFICQRIIECGDGPIILEPKDLKKGLRNLQLSMLLIVTYAELDGTLTESMSQTYEKIVSDIKKCSEMCDREFLPASSLKLI